MTSSRQASHRPGHPAMTVIRSAVVAVCAVAMMPRGHVQAQPFASPSFSSSTDLVVMNVVVADRNRAPVTGLSQDAFTVLEDNVVRPIDLFAGHDEPITLGLVIDSSGSMLANRARLAYAIGRFARTGRPDDEVFALVVGDRVTPVLPPDEPFTSSPDVLRTAVFGALGSRGRTAIWDGVLDGLDYLERGSHTRRALVVISDGQDNASRRSLEDVVTRVRSSSAPVYTMGLIDRTDGSRRPRSLKDLARVSGGEAYFPETHEAAINALESIAAQIHSAYTIGFSPSAAGRDGRYHRLDVRVRGTAGRLYQAHTRAGYVAASSEPPARH